MTVSSPAPIFPDPVVHSAFRAVPKLIGHPAKSHRSSSRDTSAMKINAIDLKPGNVLQHQNKLWRLLKGALVHAGKGRALAHAELPRPPGPTTPHPRIRTHY